MKFPTRAMGIILSSPSSSSSSRSAPSRSSRASSSSSVPRKRSRADSRRPRARLCGAPQSSTRRRTRRDVMFAATARRLARASASVAPSTTSTTRAIERSRVSFASRALADDDTAWSNALMPDLQGKVIRTKIVAVDARNGVATAVTGVRGPTTFKMSEFDRPVRVGDVVEARVTWMNNPTGHLDLECAASTRVEDESASGESSRGRETVGRRYEDGF